MRWTRVAVDGSRTSGHALGWAAEAARVHGGALEVATVFGTSGRPFGSSRGIPADRDPEDVVVERQTVLLDEYLPDRDGLRVRHAVLLGHPAEQLVRAEPAPDLLVLGTRGMGGFVGLLVGSTAHQVIEHASSPVVVVPDTERPPRSPRRIVAGVDGSRVSRRAVAWAADEARARDATLRVVTAYTSGVTAPEPQPAAVLGDPVAARDAAEQVAIGALADLVADGLQATWSAEEGRAHRVLLDRAEEADLLVVGAPAADHLGPMQLGSVAHLLLKHARVPVAVVR